jgi:site-specific recombinase XerD
MADIDSTELSTVLSDFSRYLFARRGFRPVTVHNHTSTIRRLAPALGLRPAARNIEDHIAGMMQAGASYAHITNTSVALERYCEFLGTPVKLGRPKKPHTVLTGTLSEAEVTLLINAAKNLRERAILSLLAYAGLRNRELCNMLVGDVDVASQLVHVRGTKTQRDRNAAIAPACVSVLLDYLRERDGRPDEHLFITIRGRAPYQPQDLRKLVKAAATRAGIRRRVWPHLLRHSLATNLLNRGAHLLAIKDQLGHAYIDTTMIFIHSSPARMQMEYRMYAPSYL